jgi:PKD repeat protein
MNKKLLLTLHLFLFACYTTYAQSPSWQWGARGGSADVGFGGPDESVVDMATDQHGNIYVLSYVLKTALNVDGHSITGYGGQDILITSFKCDGTYRWAKDIGSNSTEYPTALKTDTLGGVYVTGALFCDAVTDHISTDTSWSATSFKTLFLLKYDTAGNYKWFRMPEPDTLTIWSTSSYVNDMDVDGGGNSYMLCNLQAGAFASGAYIVTTPGNYILKYDKNGNFISGNSMQITGSSQLKMKRDFQKNRYYITGYLQGALSFGSYPITNSIFVGCFNNAGTFLWQRQNNFDHGDPTPRAAIDNQHNVYIVGTADVTDTFNGYGMVNAVNVGPLIVKLDTNGLNVWAKNATTNAATFTFSNPTLSNTNEVDLAGQYPGKLKWAGYSDSLMGVGGGYQIFITRFNASTGAVLGMDSLASTPGLNCDATAMVSDNFGNFYIGGDFPNQITVNGTTLTSIGGNSDFFVAKYGTPNCVCVLPTASFTHTGTSAITFTYTGSTTYDSVRWNFGDGGTSTILSPTHTYTASGTYTACIIVYGTCGNDTACQSVTATTTTGIASATSGLNNISIYPNPATEELNITGVSAISAYSISNITGATMQQGKLNTGANSVSLRGYAPGMYILDITGSDGSRIITRVVKE